MLPQDTIQKQNEELEVERLKSLENLGAAYAIAGLLGFSSFRIFGDKIRFYCPQMPATKTTKTRIEVTDFPAQPTNLTRSRINRLFPQITRTINCETNETSYQPQPLIPIDLILPSNYLLTNEEEIYNCLKNFFEKILEKSKSIDHYGADMLNLERLKEAAMCFLNANYETAENSFLLKPIQVTLHGINRSTETPYLGVVTTLQYYNQDLNPQDTQLVNLIIKNSLQMLRNLKECELLPNFDLFEWALRQSQKYKIDDNFVYNAQSNGCIYVLEEKPAEQQENKGLLDTTIDGVKGFLSDVVGFFRKKK